MSHSQNKAQWSDAEVQRKAAAKGCFVQYADDHTLQLDIDNSEDFEFFLKQVKILREHVDYLPEEFSMLLSSGGNRHIIIKLKRPIEARERILLQACLGSDRTRELLSYLATFGNSYVGQESVLLYRPLCPGTLLLTGSTVAEG
jgi:hypothetical protein